MITEVLGVLPALLVLNLRSVQVHSQDCPDPGNSCFYPDTCKRVPVDQYSVETFSGSPVFDLVVYDSGSTDVDNVCRTTYDMGDNTYLTFRTETYHNGSYSSSTVLRSFVSPGIMRQQGKSNSDGCSSCAFNDYYVSFLQDECSGVFIVYRCFTFGGCVQEFSGEDVVDAFSTSQNISEACFDQICSTVNSLGLNLGTFNRLPNRLNKNCVTKIGDLTAVDACSVSACDSVQLE